MTSFDTPRAEVGAQLPWFISVDDHVIEPPHVWTSRLPAKFQAAAPHYERRRVGGTRAETASGFITDLDDDGVETDVWVYGDVVKAIRSNIAGAGLDRMDMGLGSISFDEMRPGCYDAAARVADMELNHVEASLCFPQMSRFCGQEFSEATDKDLSLLCIAAYNDWMVEEWAASAPGQLIPLCIVPLWDPELAAAEVRRNALRGVHAVSFSENPYTLGFGSIHSGHWDPFFLACDETDTTVCLHIGSSSVMGAVSPDAPMAVGISLSSGNAMSSLMEYLFSGVLARYPGLNLAYSESQIGWIPFQLERADTVWEQHRGWHGLDTSERERPSFYFHRQVYGCFFSDFFGLHSLSEVGADNVTFETDYPHTDSTWPDTEMLARKMFANLSDEDIYKVARGNAIRMLHLDGERDR
jgi:predicted TIM-barrel fold metal-dependent hydrolase